MSEILFSDAENADLQVDALYRGGRAGNPGDDPISRLLPVGNMGGSRYKGVSEVGAKRGTTLSCFFLFCPRAKIRAADPL